MSRRRSNDPSYAEMNKLLDVKRPTRPPNTSQCSQCRGPRVEFGDNRRWGSSMCRKCKGWNDWHDYVKPMRSRTLLRVYQQQADEAGKPMEVTLEDVERMLRDTPMCVSRVPISHGPTGRMGNNLLAPVLRRRDRTKCFTRDNTHIITRAANHLLNAKASGLPMPAASVRAINEAREAHSRSALQVGLPGDMRKCRSHDPQEAMDALRGWGYDGVNKQAPAPDADDAA